MSPTPDPIAAFPNDGALAGGSSLADPGFVGRQDELALLRTTIATTQAGAGSLVLISGEPGIGKTRLAIEATSEARAQGVQVVWGRCWEAGGAPPYWPWIEVLRQVLGGTERPSTGALGHHAAQLARLVPEAFCDTEPAAAPADPESGRFLLFDAVATLLRLAAARRPLLVVVDDFHSADRVSVLLLAFLARSLKDCSLAIIGTYREAEARSLLDLVDPLAELARTASRLALRGLTSADVRSMLRRSDGTLPSTVLVEKIHRATDGNPFFVREIARLLPADEAAEAAFPVPEAIRDTVRQRLSRLPSSTRSLLTVAAVVGREFDGVIVSCAAGVDMIQFLACVDDAIGQGTIDVVPEVNGRFSFRHALIRETVYDDLSPAVRIQLHKDIRDALAQISQMAPDRFVAELAHHALAAAPAGDDDRFIEHGVRAARVAVQRMAFEEAVQLYQRTIDALVHASPDGRRHCELLLALGEAKEWANDVRGSRAVIEQAATIARRLDAADLLARAALTVGGVEALKATAMSRCETATNLLFEALARIGRNDLGLRARLRSRLALHHLQNNAMSDALSASAAALIDARECADGDVLALALISRHAAVSGPDHLEERYAIASELSELAMGLESREYAMRAQALRVVNALERGDIPTVDQATRLHARLADEAQDPFERWANLSWRAARALLLGYFDEATLLVHEALGLTRSVPGLHALEVNGPAGNLGQLVVIEETRYGTPPDPAQIMDHANRFGDIVVWRTAKLHALTRLGRVPETRAELALVMDDVLSRMRWGTWLGAMSVLADAIFLLDDQRRAEAIYPKLRPYAQHNITNSFTSCRGSVSRFLGLLAATLGDRDAAEGHFEDALAMNRRMGARPHVAATLYDHATALLRRAPDSEDTRRAVEMCQEALGIARELGMPGLELRCNELLAAHAEACDSAADAPRQDDFALIAHGSFWTLSHAGSEVVVKDRKGLHYIAELLRNPDRDVHSRDLVAVFRTSSAPSFIAVAAAAPLDQSGAHTGDFSEPLVDPASRRAYARRLDELDEELYAAASAGDPEHLAVLREERQALEREMARITGLGGRARRIGDAERMRVAVTRAIRNALAEIASADPNVGGVLARRIRTGNFCRYSSTTPS